MASLFVVGNLRQFTFANAVAAADRECHRHYGSGLRRVFVFHSPESRSELGKSPNWREFLRLQGLKDAQLVEHTVDLQAPGEPMREAADLVVECLRALQPNEPVFIDLTNGDSLYKNVFSTLSFLVGAQHPFVLLSSRLVEGHEEVTKVDRRARSQELANRFWSDDELEKAYQPLPDPAEFDRLGPEWLTEVRRFRRRAARCALELEKALGEDDFHRQAFENEVLFAVDSWFRGEKLKDTASLGSSVRSIGRAFEELLHGVEARLGLSSASNLARRIDGIGLHLRRTSGGSDPDLFIELSTLLRRVRNLSTHQRASLALARLHASLSAELLFAAATYFVALFERNELLPGAAEPRPPTPPEPTAMPSVSLGGRVGERYFFGLDGDDTGRHLESLFTEDAEAVEFVRFSKVVQTAIQSVAAEARKPPIQAKVLFNAGDDLLFSGYFEPAALERLRALYRQDSDGRTCSIGFGATPRAAYVALKMAKARPGKDSVVGVVLRETEND